MNFSTKEIVCIANCSGRIHDFALYKSSIGSAVANNIKIKADSGYQGISNLHQNSQTPIKKPKNGALSKEDKEHNKQLSKKRILIENINAKVKVFKITSNKYRNRCKRFAFRVSLICGIINFESRV